MRRVLRKSVWIPALLALYLIVFVVLGWGSFVAGLTSPLLYLGGTAVVAICIALLHFHLKKRESDHQKESR